MVMGTENGNLLVVILKRLLRIWATVSPPCQAQKAEAGNSLTAQSINFLGRISTFETQSQIKHKKKVPLWEKHLKPLKGAEQEFQNLKPETAVELEKKRPANN